MSTVIFSDFCLTCNGEGTIYAGVLYGQERFRTCPTCKGTGQYRDSGIRKPKGDKGRTGPLLKAFCPKCAEPLTTHAYFKAVRYANLTCTCGCSWRMLIEDAKAE